MSPVSKLQPWLQGTAFEELLQSAAALSAAEQEKLAQAALGFSTKLFERLEAPQPEGAAPAKASKPAWEAQRQDQDFQAKRSLLKSFAPFANLTEEEADLLAMVAELRPLEEGQAFIRQNQPVEGLFFLAQPAEVRVQGGRGPVAVRRGLFGERALLAEEQVSAFEVVSMGEGNALFFPQKELWELLPWMYSLFQTLCREVQVSLEKDLLQVNRQLMNSREQARLAGEVLDNLGQASLCLDEKGEIGYSYSLGVELFLGRKNLAGLPFADLVLRNDRAALKKYYRAMHELFDAEQPDFDQVLENLPLRLFYNGRHFDLHYSFATDSQGNVINLFVRLEDISNELEDVEFKRQQRDQEAEDFEILDRARQETGYFLTLLELADQAYRSLAKLSEIAPQQAEAAALKDLRRKLHNLKDLCERFAMYRLAHATEAMEEAVTHLQRGMYEMDLVEPFMNFESEYQYAYALHDQIGEDFLRMKMGVNFTKIEYAVLLEMLKDAQYNNLSQAMRNKVCRALSEVSQGWEEEINSLAGQLGKSVRLWVDADESVFMFEDQVRALNFEMRHLYRNALDHGIETPAQRTEAGKGMRGNLWLKVKQEGTKAVLILRDDGRGLNQAAIEASARENPNLDQAQVEALLAKGEHWKILFLPGFNAAGRAGLDPGRAAGLDGVRSCIEELGGSISMITEPGQGCQVTIRLPLPF